MIIFGVRNQWIEEPATDLTIIECNLHACRHETVLQITIMGLGIAVGISYTRL